ncbi:MAG: hypothetical protein KDD55_09015, partial [Bdellovibrionales bacterium]|nr:hypothetical protein [Bdellovibrionales bacterium]
DTPPSPERVQEVNELFAEFASPVRMIWINSEPVQAWLDELKANGVEVGPNGKGRTVWLGMGYMLASGMEVIALHDCDIIGYTGELIDRLFFPAVKFDYEFVKGFYARAHGGLFGRVTRLLVWPLLGSFMRLHPGVPFVDFARSFRYPLSGEFAMGADLAERISLENGWGLEVGSLAQVFKLLSLSRVAQVDLAMNYEHYHQPLGVDVDSGLQRMAVEIVSSLLRTMASTGVTFEKHALLAAFEEVGTDLIRGYRSDAGFNGIPYDRRAEVEQLQLYAHSLEVGFEEFEQAPGRGASVRLPSWRQLNEEFPDISLELVRRIEVGPEHLRQTP